MKEAAVKCGVSSCSVLVRLFCISSTVIFYSVQFRKKREFIIFIKRIYLPSFTFLYIFPISFLKAEHNMAQQSMYRKKNKGFYQLLRFVIGLDLVLSPRGGHIKYIFPLYLKNYKFLLKYIFAILNI